MTSRVTVDIAPETAYDWMSRMACTDADPDIFHPMPGSNGNEAKVYCRHCPVTAQCLALASRTGDDSAVMGGLTAAERRSRALAESRIRQRNCARCGSQFWTRRARFCSKPCRDQSYHAQRSNRTSLVGLGRTAAKAAAGSEKLRIRQEARP